jgi:serine/threonine protein kinase
MYHMATGQPPFMGTGYEVLRRHMDAAPPRVAEVNPQITPALDAVIMKALAKEPRERFASADEMAAALRPQLLV